MEFRPPEAGAAYVELLRVVILGVLVLVARFIQSEG
jgi:hypothetical protein